MTLTSQQECQGILEQKIACSWRMTGSSVLRKKDMK